MPVTNTGCCRFALFEAGLQRTVTTPKPHVSAAPHVGLTKLAPFGDLTNPITGIIFKQLKTMENKEKDSVVIDDFDFSLIADFFKRVDRQGPGGDWETRLATSLIPDFKRKIRIADIGCGKGSQTFVLADEYDADIDAIDLLPEMIEGIREKSKARRLEKGRMLLR